MKLLDWFRRWSEPSLPQEVKVYGRDGSLKYHYSFEQDRELFHAAPTGELPSTANNPGST